MILALDTALETCSAALMNDGKILARLSEPMVKGHAERLMPMVQELFQAAGKKPKDITLIGVTIGPGSFTGLRVALAAARNMGVALDIPVTGVSTLDALAENFPNEEVMSLIDARHDKCYAQIKKGSVYTFPPALYENSMLKGLYNSKKNRLVGSGARFLTTENVETQIDIINVLTLADKNPNEQISPFYLKDADVTPQIKGVIQRV